MKIKNLFLDNSIVNKFGLEEFKSSKLNSIVALVGKNGSGKSRYLNAIRESISTAKINDLFNEKFDFIPDQIVKSVASLSVLKPIFEAEEKLADLKLKLTQSPQDQQIKQEFTRQNTKLQSLMTSLQFSQKKNMIDNTLKIMNTELQNRIKVINANDIRALKQSIESNKTNVTTFQEIVDSTQENMQIDELSMINSSALTFLRNLPHKLAHDELHTKGDEKKFKSRVSYKRYVILKNLVSEFLDKDLEWESKTSQIEEKEDGVITKTSGFWTINKREFNYNDFSDGEKVLFTYSLLLFLLSINPRIKFKESIIFIDEPEMNLHPKAQIKLIKAISELIKEKGQLFIATHSLSIVANLEYSAIHLVRDNSLRSPSSSIPFDSVDDLMGFNEHYNKIVEFLVSTPSWAMTNFMSECFNSPEVFEFANEADPQVEIFGKMLQSSTNLNVLDFGSGKGRLLERIKESSSWQRVQNYDCFDIEPEYNEALKSKGAKVVYNELNDLPENKYDLVVLVNVLHEIHIDHWVSTINKLKLSLKTNGFLAIIEDIELPIGELPNEHGFLLLGKDELSILLGGHVQYMTPTNPRYANRIICGFSQKDKISSLNKKRLISTLEKLKSNSLKDIEDYRKDKNKEAKLGRLYALKANSYVNSELAINKLNK